MHRLLVVLAFAACDSRSSVHFEQAQAPQRLALATIQPAPAVAGKRVTVAKHQYRVGELRVSHTSGTFEGSATMGAKRVAVTGTHDKSRRFEVLALDGELVTKAKVSYPAHSLEMRIGDVAGPWTPYLRGHTYVVEARGGKLEATRDGAAVSGTELEKLVDDLRGLVGAPDFIDRAIGGKEITANTVIELPASELAGTLADKAVVKEASLRFLDVEGDVATFEQYVASRIMTEDGAFDDVTRTLYRVSVSTGEEVGESSRSAVLMEKSDRAMSTIVTSKTVLGDG